MFEVAVKGRSCADPYRDGECKECCQDSSPAQRDLYSPFRVLSLECEPQ